ncbi:cytochrome P450 [Streptomyces sp. NPDC003832]
MTSQTPDPADAPAAGRCPFTDPSSLFADLAAARDRPGLERGEALHGRYVVSRYDEVVEALRRPDVFSSKPTVPDMPPPWRDRFEGRVPGRGTLLGHDNPTHDRLRGAVNSFFVPRELARFEPWIEEAAHRQVDEFADRGATDLKSSFGLPLALKVIARIVGLDTSRAEWIGLALSFFAGPRDTNFPGVGPDEKADALLDLHDYVLSVMAERREERRDDLISHVWNVRDSGEAEMTDFEMLSLFPGLMLAGHETSSNLICTGTAHLLSRPGAWEAAQHDDASRGRALEELFRYESAITGMPRLVTEDTVLGGTPLRAGDEVFLAYASASRDAAYFDAPDALRPDRRFEQPHLGFGRGIHACLGAPLARLLLRTELRVLHERLPGLRLDLPDGKVPYTAVSEGRGVAALPVAWDPAPARTPRPPTPSRARTSDIPARITARTTLTPDVVEFELAPAEGTFPSWQPGAHIDVRLAPGLTRQYSLCGDPADQKRWRIAVRRDKDGRGGSLHAHELLRSGDPVVLRGPRNNFALADAPGYLFVAGGIGVTPFLPMVAEAARRGVPWRLVLLGRCLDTMPYAAGLSRAHPDAVTLWPSAERGRIDLGDLLAATPSDTAAYCCGPEELLADLEERCLDQGRVLHTERFAPRPRTGETADGDFEVTLAGSGRTVEVRADESVLDAVNRAGADVLSTCREGTCGSCEVRVLAGIPDHRDSVLSAQERAAGEYMMTCVSRALSPSLTLDL